MVRMSRIVVPGCPHHVTQRGNRGQEVFLDDEDRRVYLGLVRRYAEKHHLAIWAYCLMSNHVHFVVVPAQENSLALTFHGAHTLYAMHFNTRTGDGGHLWQGRYYSTPMDDEHLWAAVRYVERNPVRAKMVAHAADYEWSSAQGHCGLRRDPLLDAAFPPPGQVQDWAEWLTNASEDNDAMTRLRRMTRVGRPCGGHDFLLALEEGLGRRVRRRKPGPRPKS